MSPEWYELPIDRIVEHGSLPKFSRRPTRFIELKAILIDRFPDKKPEIARIILELERAHQSLRQDITNTSFQNRVSNANWELINLIQDETGMTSEQAWNYISNITVYGIK